MNAKDKILQNIKVNELTGCWIWQRGVDTPGYGQICVNGKQRRTHRVAYELFKGPIPEGLCVCHSCDNRRCCNPSHLWLGTQQDNIQDMIKKGRRPNQKGSKNNQAKLTEENVIEIKKLLANKVVQRIIGDKFGVHNATINDIKMNKTWKHLKEE